MVLAHRERPHFTKGVTAASGRVRYKTVQETRRSSQKQIKAACTIVYRWPKSKGPRAHILGLLRNHKKMESGYRANESDKKIYYNH